jgi:dolichol-phosphate mannosyltransferase
MKYVTDCASAASNGHKTYVDPAAEASVEHQGAVLSVIVPTFNERDNVEVVVSELSAALAGIEWEVVFVDDDSPDGTAKLARELGRRRSRIRCIQRIGRRGLSSACIEGMLGTSAPYIVVMDGDLQHDPAIIPTMLDRFVDPKIELVVGSRYVEGGGSRDWGRARRIISRVATCLGHVLVPDDLRDPMSGFFMIHRPLLDEVVRSLSGRGFKILLDIVASARRPISYCEVPFVFRPRHAGVSKLDSFVAWEYLMLLADKLFGRYVPVRFLPFATIGALGLGVHLTVLSILFRWSGTEFAAAQALAALVSMVFNYALNNALTYRDRRRRGAAWLTGLLSFVAVCGVGAIANVGVASYFFRHSTEWVIAALAGVAVGAVWNYAVTSVYTWGQPKAATK